MRFTTRFALALVIGLGAAVALSPFVAMVVASAGWRFPFPRIFDRTMMATLLLAIILFGRGLNFKELMAQGFGDSRSRAMVLAARGLLVSLGTIAVLFALAILARHAQVQSLRVVLPRIPSFIASAVAIAIIEEAFFRVFLLGGMKHDFGTRVALIVSSIFYAIAHLVRSPVRFYVTGLVPTAGLANLAHSFDQLSVPSIAIPTLLGLFLLGLVLGQAFLTTGSVYLSIGMHCGFVLGAKMWPKLILNRNAIPWWIAGPGPVPLIAAPAGWCLALLILLLLPRLTATERH
jgi:membrane protease YdiL (CAAX protease family)